MPTEAASGSGALPPRNKPITRSSIRQSFGLSSVGKALADVMHKESKENSDKASKKEKAKDTAARRTSAIHLAPARSSVEKPAAKKKDEATSPDVKTITRHTRRQSALRKLAAEEDKSSSPSDNGSPKASISARSSASVRNRNSLVSSGLPKYRPRSMLGESTLAVKKPPSPTHSARRRRLSSSDDETDDVKTPQDLSPLNVPADKSARPISPLPHRNALKVNLTSAINVRPATPEKKDHEKAAKGSPASIRTTSTKASKAGKVTPSPSPASASARSGLPRPPSSASSSASASSRTPRTPTTPTLLGNMLKRSAGSLRQKTTEGSGSSRRGPIHTVPESPLGRISARKNAASSSHTRGESGPTTPTPRILMEGNSMDSIEAEDVEFMLSSVVSPTAPTPALPRLRPKGDDGSHEPQTPSRSFLPSRSNLSYASPAPPSSTDSSPFLRPKARQPGNDRGSILSWEQLAQHSRTLEDEDVEHMLSEIPAPFRAGAISPSLSVIDIPESPSLSALPSPTGYGSISQVLLPDVTPSPAVHNSTHLFDNLKPETPTSTDGATVTLLRLQLAAAESRAQERLAQMQSLEQQLHAAKEARLRDAEDLAKQISQLEEQVHGNLLVDNQRVEQISVLEEMLRDAQTAQDKSVKDAARRAEEAMSAARAAALQVRQVEVKATLALAAREAGAAWSTVRDTAESELDFVRANREMLSVLLAGLDHSQRQLACMAH
ncbi:hypothetical protein C8Q70DRAFT_562995 [Cubamyces menziesii]|uniref:Uncharacterized protein n=1 Tax=Trametes cubensis TaxID=1111947 RepID=A0AAD7XBQ6_9APHY|nr:hypothetical protein C8Q70DRAFT_562995 [Cubamyces menziesii]KAJ8489615.1 hypothetical protein ONZ51_g2831 [Trametes cubensis]